MTGELTLQDVSPPQSAMTSSRSSEQQHPSGVPAHADTCDPELSRRPVDSVESNAWAGARPKVRQDVVNTHNGKNSRSQHGHNVSNIATENRSQHRPRGDASNAAPSFAAAVGGQSRRQTGTAVRAQPASCQSLRTVTSNAQSAAAPGSARRIPAWFNESKFLTSKPNTSNLTDLKKKGE